MHVYATGSNGSGQLALAHTDDVHTFTLTHFHPSITHLLPSSSIIDLVSSSTHALLLLRTSIDGVSRNILLGAGTNTLGQLGPRCALWEDTRAVTSWKAVDLLSGTGVGGHVDWEAVKIAATWTTSFVVYRRLHRQVDGGIDTAVEVPEEVVISCGSNDFGELGKRQDEGQGTRPADMPTVVDLGMGQGERVEMIRGGQRHIIALISDGKTQRVMGWGAARKGELDPTTLDMPGSNETRTIPAASTTSKGKGKGKAITRPTYLPPTELALPIHAGSRITDIRLGASHMLALLSDGTVLAWGSDAKGQTRGLSSIRDAIAISATWGGSYVLRQEGMDGSKRLNSHGANGYGQLLRQTTESDVFQSAAIASPSGRGIKGFVTGTEHVLVHMKNQARPDNDELWVGGWNEHGNLGLGDAEDRPELVKVDLNGMGIQENGGTRKIKGIWGGCAASWLWLD